MIYVVLVARHAAATATPAQNLHLCLASSKLASKQVHGNSGYERAALRRLRCTCHSLPHQQQHLHLHSHRRSDHPLHNNNLIWLRSSDQLLTIDIVTPLSPKKGQEPIERKLYRQLHIALEYINLLPFFHSCLRDKVWCCCVLYVSCSSPHHRHETSFDGAVNVTRFIYYFLITTASALCFKCGGRASNEPTNEWFWWGM